MSKMSMTSAVRGRSSSGGSGRSFFLPAALILLLSFLVFFAEVGDSRSLDTATVMTSISSSLNIIQNSAADQWMAKIRQRGRHALQMDTNRKLLMIHTDDYDTGANTSHDPPPGSK